MIDIRLAYNYLKSILDKITIIFIEYTYLIIIDTF